MICGHVLGNHCWFVVFVHWVAICRGYFFDTFNNSLFDADFNIFSCCQIGFGRHNFSQKGYYCKANLSLKALFYTFLNLLHKYIELSIRSSHVHKNGNGSTSIILFMYSMYLRIHLLNTSHILSLKSLIKVVYYFSGFIDCAHVLGGLFSRQHLLHWDIN